MGRPTDSAPASYRRIYYRLLEGPLWLENYRSTGLGRTTVHKRLDYLLSLELVTLRKEGHKKLYEINKEKGVKDWLPTLANKAEWEEINRPPSKDLRQWAKEIIEMIRPGVRATGRLGTLSKDSENEKILESIMEALPKASPLKIVDCWHRYQTLRICPECLKDKKDIVPIIEDPETGEIVCSRCGTVLNQYRIY